MMRQYKANLEDGRISEKRILEILAGRQEEAARFKELQGYYLGRHRAIAEKESGRKIVVPYARSLITIITGFLYKPGLIKYDAEDLAGGDFSRIEEAFAHNGEELLNAELGQDQAIYGEAYELHWIDEDAEENFARVSPAEIVPVYSFEVRPRLITAIRMYDVMGKDAWSSQKLIDIYYPDVIQKYVWNHGCLEVRETEQFHPYKAVPLAIFRNNRNSIGDIEPIQGLIDAYDSLVSSYADDEEKFAEAVLLMFGRVLDDDAVEKLAKLRVIDGLDKDSDDLRYLTKDESQSARRDLIALLRNEIYRQSFVPDMTDPAVLGQKSGEAFQYLFALFELMAAVKESYFTQGLRERLRLVATATAFPSEPPDISKIDISFTRNLPKDSVMWANIVQSLWGMLPPETLVPKLPFVHDPQATLKAMAEQPFSG